MKDCFLSPSRVGIGVTLAIVLAISVAAVNRPGHGASDSFAEHVERTRFEPNRRLAPRDFTPISIVALLANPQKYDRMPVQFGGFIGLGEGAAIFMDTDSLRHRLNENSIFLDTTTCEDLHLFSQASGKACGVRGVVVASDRGPGGSACTLMLKSWYRMPEP